MFMQRWYFIDYEMCKIEFQSDLAWLTFDFSIQQKHFCTPYRTFFFTFFYIENKF